MPFTKSVLINILASLLLASFVCLLLGLASRTAAFSDYELWGYDFLVNRGMRQGTNSDIVIVDFDDATFDRIKKYPIPRSSIAEVIDRIAAGSPRVVGLDLFLSESRGPEEDAQMSAALSRAGNVVLASQARAGGIPAVRPLPQFCTPEIPEQDSGDCKEVPAGAFAYAAVNLPIDSDGFIRSFLLFESGAGKEVSFPVMIAQLAKGEALQPESRGAVRFLGRTIPTTSRAQPQVLIGDWCAECIKHISALSLLEQAAEENHELAGKIVLVGQSNDAARDLLFTPVFRPSRQGAPRTRVSGLEIQAAAVQTLLSGKAISILKPWKLWTIVFCLLVLSVWVQIRYSLRSSMFVVFLLVV